MNIESIIKKADYGVVDQSEMIYLIKQYVYDKKGVNIKPFVETRFGTIVCKMELMRMFDMFNYAHAYYKQKLNV